jgi:glycosyltransferase involved in cell wall biosynthesis
MEVIVADGLSTDDTKLVVAEMASGADIAVTLIDNPALTAPAALNRAIAVSKGSMIIRVDGHCEIAGDYVANCVRLLMLGMADGVGGPIETIAESPQAEAIAIAMSSKFGVGGSAFRTVHDKELEVDTIAFPGYRRALFDRIGGFDEELVRNQDDEFNYRVRKNGGRLILSPSIRSRYYSRSSFRALWRQYFQYGYWKVRVLQLHPGQMSVRQFVPFLFVATLIALAVMSIVSVAAAWLFICLLAVYGLANLIASLVSSRRTGLGSVPRISLSFAILHFAYGSGFLFGLVAFRRRWFGQRSA